jgi:hypothetical protein
MDAQEYDALIVLKARIEALADEARALQKEVSPVFKSVERRYNRMADDKPKKYAESLRLMSIGFINDNLDGVIEYADAAVDALENATADANEVKDISYNN